MRVAVVAEWYPSTGDPVLGIWAHRQALAARSAGADVRVLALRRPIPPLSVARGLLHIPPAIGALGRWIAGARTSLRPETLDGLEVMPVPFVSPPRPISYGGWGYWMSPTLGRALGRLYADWGCDVVHAHCLAPAGHAAARWVARRPPADRPAFVVSAHGPDMIHVASESAVGRRACRAALGAADLVMANSRWARAPLRGDRGPITADGGRPPRGGRARRGCSRCGRERPRPDRDGRPPGRTQAPRRRAAGDGAARPGAPTRVPGDRRRPAAGAARAAGGRARARRSRALHRSAAQPGRGGARGGVRPVRDAGRRGAVRRGVRRGDGGRAAGDRQPRRGRAGGHRRRRRGDGARGARRPRRARGRDLAAVG